MLSRVFAATVRHRRPLLAVAVGLAVAYVVVDAGSGASLFPWLAGSAAACLVLGLVAYTSFRPAGLTVRGDVPAFDTPASPAPVYLCLTFLALGASNVAEAVEAVTGREEGWRLDLVVAVGYVVVVALWLRNAWGGVGVRLRPDGVLDRHILGSLFVPWEALTLDRPAWPADGKDQVLLNYRRPDLVRRRGIGPGARRLSGANVDRHFLALAVQHYVAHPQRRHAIGTDAEHRRLMEALG